MASSKKKKGGQEGNTNAEKWTEKRALELGNELLEWICPNEVDGTDEHEGHIYFEKFIVIIKRLHPGTISYLSNKFDSFSKLIGHAKKIQELKLVEYGVGDRLNATMTKFALVNNHDWSDKRDLNIDANLNTRPDYNNLTDEEVALMNKLQAKAKVKNA